MVSAFEVCAAEGLSAPRGPASAHEHHLGKRGDPGKPAAWPSVHRRRMEKPMGGTTVILNCKIRL